MSSCEYLHRRSLLAGYGRVWCGDRKRRARSTTSPATGQGFAGRTCDVCKIWWDGGIWTTGVVSGRPCPGRSALASKRRAVRPADRPLKPGIPRLHGIDAAVELPQIGQAANGQPMGVLLAGFHQGVEVVRHLFPRLRARRRRAVGEQIVGMHDPVDGSFHGTLWFLTRWGVEIRQLLWPRTAPRT